MLPIARETRLFVVVLLIAAILATVYLHYWIATALWGLLAVAIFLLRDFKRNIPARPLGVVSPVDGVITSVSRAEDPFLKREALVIRMSQHIYGEFNVHSPIEGKVTGRWWPESAKQEDDLPPEHFALWLQTDEGDDTVVAVDLHGHFRFMQCGVQRGERTGQGRRCGLVGFGRPVTIYLPVNARVAVDPGQRVRAGSDEIASFVHS